MTAARYCFLTTFYPPYSFGGDGIAVERLARALARRGADVTVVHDVDSYNALHAGPEPRYTREDVPGLRVVELRSRLRALAPLLTQQLGRPVVHGRRLRQLLEGGGYDVIVFHNISLVGGPAVLAYGGREAVRIYMAHDHWLVCPTHVLWRHDREVCTERQCLRCVLHHRRPPQIWRSTGLLNRHLDDVDTFIAMSRFSRDKHREFGFPKDMEVLPPFLDPPSRALTPADASPHGRPYFIAAGRLERMKGFDGLIRAFARYPGADLLVAGEGGQEDALKDLARGNPRIQFLGRLGSESLDRYYRHALALVVPSVCYETFGITVIEAFRQGTPVIARRLGPFPELLGAPDLGTLFRTDEELLDAMSRMQNDPGWRQARSEASLRAFSERWAEDVVVPRFLEIVQAAAERKRRARAAHADARRARA